MMLPPPPPPVARILIAVLVCIVCCFINTHAATLADGQWLVALYQATKGDQSTCTANWNIANPGSVCDTPTSWNKVTCTGNVVTSIGLVKCNLTGSLPPVPADGALQSVTSLSFSNNYLTGDLPDTFSRLSSLKYLQLNMNSFTGRIPLSWSNLSRVQSVDVSSNGLTSSLPASWVDMPSLSYIDAQSNHLIGGLPPEWSTMPSLQYLYLTNNSLAGSLPESWSSMPSLGFLYLGTNAFDGSLPHSWSTIPSLQLYLTQNSLSGSIPVEWYDANATQLWCDENYLTGNIPETWMSNTSQFYAILGLNCFNASEVSYASSHSRNSRLQLGVQRSPAQCTRKTHTRRVSMSRDVTRSGSHPTSSISFVVSNSESMRASHTPAHAVAVPVDAPTSSSVVSQVTSNIGTVSMAFTAIASPVASISAASTGFSSVVRLQTALSLSRRVQQCSSNDGGGGGGGGGDDATGTAVMDNPLRLFISSLESSLQYAAGCVIGNAILIVVASPILSAGEWLWNYMRKRHVTKKEIHGTLLAHVLRTLPGGGWVLIVLLLQPSVTSAFTLLFQGEGNGKAIAIGVVGVVLYVICVVAFVGALLYRSSKEGKIKTKSRSSDWMLVRAASLLEPYQQTRRWYCGIDIVIPLVCGGLAAVPLDGSVAGCMWVPWVILSITASSTVSTVVVRPAQTHLDNVINGVANSLALTAMALSITENISAAEIVLNVLSWVSLIPPIVAVLRAILVSGYASKSVVLHMLESMTSSSKPTEAMTTHGKRSDEEMQCRPQEEEGASLSTEQRITLYALVREICRKKALEQTLPSATGGL